MPEIVDIRENSGGVGPEAKSRATPSPRLSPYRGEEHEL
jgi:hypothetical protein